MEQVMCDVPRTTYVIGGQEFGAATGEQAAANVKEKKVCVVLSPTATSVFQACHPPLTLPFTSCLLHISLVSYTSLSIYGSA